MSRRDSLRPSGILAQFTQKQIAKIPERASLAQLARALRMTYDGVYRWTTEDTLIGFNPLPDGIGSAITVPPLKTHRVETPGGAIRVYVLKAELLPWLEATRHLR
ncbi:MAG: hypothetical protein ACREUA_00310 [Burkholderiales bacterium]